EFADNGKLKAALFNAGGSGIQIQVRMDLLRTAISDVNAQRDCTSRRRATRDFGWTAEGDAYLVPGGRITAKGFEAVNDPAELAVDLSDQPPASYLGMQPLSAEELLRVKRHIIEDLLALHDSDVTYSLLAAAAAAVLVSSVEGINRPAIWLVGLTG